MPFEGKRRVQRSSQPGCAKLLSKFSIRTLQPREIALAVDWAAAEGWNPGLADATCFATVDPAGFLLGEIDGEPAATISVVNYDDRFAFLGFYIVRAALRGRGYGWRLWQAGMAHAGARSVGLDGVVTQQENYKNRDLCLPIATCATAPGLRLRRHVHYRIWFGVRSRTASRDSQRFRSRRSWRTMPWCFPPRVLLFCGHGSTLRVTSAAPWCATAVFVRGACSGLAGAGSRSLRSLLDDRASAETVFAALVAAVGGGKLHRRPRAQCRGRRTCTRGGPFARV